MKNQYGAGDYLERGKEGLRQFGGLQGGLARKRGGVFEGGLIPQCRLWAGN